MEEAKIGVWSLVELVLGDCEIFQFWDLLRSYVNIVILDIFVYVVSV